MYKINKRVISFVLALFMLVSSAAGADLTGPDEVIAASSLNFEAMATRASVLKFLDRYDKDGAFIARRGDAISKKINGQRITSYISSGSKISDVENLIVHEMTHAYGYKTYKYDRTTYYLGNNKSIDVKYTSTYRTKKMASSVPSGLRTTRYKVYVADKSTGVPGVYTYGDSTAESGSNVLGAYGLMEEFAAYRMGLANTTKLYPYFVSKKKDPAYALKFILYGEDDMLSYAEFKYFVLHYMYYAKKHYPKVYKGIMANKNFCRTYYRLEKSYASLVKKYKKQVKTLGNAIKASGDEYQIEGNTAYFYDASKKSYLACTLYARKDFNKLTKEMKKSKYKKIHNAIVKKGK